MFMPIVTGQHGLPNDTVQNALILGALPQAASAHPFGEAQIGVAPDADLIFVMSEEPLNGADILATQRVLVAAG